MATMTAEPETRLTCARCGNDRPPHRERYCTRLCADEAMDDRRRAAGKPVYRGRPPSPFDKFVRATVPDKRVQVQETIKHQLQAETLIARGCCAYRNRAGLIRDIGVPRKPSDRHRVWGFPEPMRAHDSRQRNMLLAFVGQLIDSKAA